VEEVQNISGDTTMLQITTQQLTTCLPARKERNPW
jgi:hypothetical protein